MGTCNTSRYTSGKCLNLTWLVLAFLFECERYVPTVNLTIAFWIQWTTKNSEFQIYVADRERLEIQCFKHHNNSLVLGKCFPRAREGTEGYLSRPTGLALEPYSDRLIVTDKDNHRVCIFGIEEENLLLTFGKKGSGDGEFEYPWGVAVSPDERFIAVADFDNHRVQLFTSAGVYVQKYSLLGTNPLAKKADFTPRSLAFNNDGKWLIIW